jgi:tRNA pseudouridine65 synthase
VILDIIYKDKHLVAINKPHGLLVHPSPIARNADVFALQLLRDQLGQKVYPVHRLDRKTSGVLLFALDPKILSDLSGQFRDQALKKEYLAIVRGHTADEDSIDYPLKNDKGKVQEALTHYTTLSRTEIPYTLEKHASQRYSLVLVEPKTGRMHQIRKHFSHIDHPIIGDRPHGCNKQNRFFKNEFGMTSMLLHALNLECTHPVSTKRIILSASPQAVFEEMIQTLGFQYYQKKLCR